MDRRHVLVSLGTTLGAGCLRLSSETPGADETATDQPTAQTTRDRPPDRSTTTETDESPQQTTTTKTNDSRERTTTTESDETATESEYPLGLGNDGVSPVLIDAHRRTLSRTTYRADITTEDLVHDEMRTNRTARIDGEAETAVVTRGGTDETTIYRTPDGTVWCYPLDDGTTYGQNGESYEEEVHRLAEPVEIAVQTGLFGTPERIESGPAVWRVTADEVDDPSRLFDEHFPNDYDEGSVEQFSATLEVTERSVVRSLVLEFELVGMDELISTRTELAVSKIGELTVSEPDWVSTARERAAQLSVAVADERRALRVTHDGGNPVVAGTDVALEIELENNRAEMIAPFESGQTMFVYVENDEVRIARGLMPTDAEPTPIPRDKNIYFVMAYRGMRYYLAGSDELLE